jgi:hypothetical protein
MEGQCVWRTLEQLDVLSAVDTLQPVDNLVFVPVPVRVSVANSLGWRRRHT